MSNTTDSSKDTGTDTRLSARAAELADLETARLVDRTQGSKAWYERALRTLPLGVPSSFQAGDPYPIYIERGEGVVVGGGGHFCGFFFNHSFAASPFSNFWPVIASSASATRGRHACHAFHRASQ